MKEEFHYQVTYLVAVRAGFDPAAARLVAHAGQYVDDNTTRYEITDHGRPVFANEVSQTVDLRRPDPKLDRVYTLFHFLPGDPAAAAARLDGAAWHPQVTTPDAPAARRILDAALTAGDLYRIGIAAHAYVDTWAHQNFIGARHAQNGSAVTFGHLLVGSAPDEVGRRWTDPRLVAGAVDNTPRFLEAAQRLYGRLRGTPAAEDDRLRQDLGEIFALPEAKTRRAAYHALALTAPYGATALPRYASGTWFQAALRPGFNDQNGGGTWTWATDAYASTDWYRFQQAVTAHREAALEVLRGVAA